MRKLQGWVVRWVSSSSPTLLKETIKKSFEERN
jgi:hypothetical protein